ncbi:MAG: tripartite tricarboxylate transporter substrate-binding protein [Trueperaceae bacterium]
MTTARSNNPQKRFTALLAAVLLAALLGSAVAQDDYPNERLNWTIAFGPGGGNDIMSRTLIEILDQYELYPPNVVATNREGGSGAVGWGYLYSQAGDPYQISSTSGSFITTPLQADTPWHPTDFTPIAMLASDDLVLLVQGGSDIDSLEGFIETAREERLSIGGIGAVNVDFIVPTLLADRAGFEFDYVSFNAAGELNTALLSGSLDAIVSNPGEILGLLESGDMKALGYSGVSTPEALGDIPTFGDVGYPIGISMPRGLIMAPDVSPEVQQWWIETMQQVVETPEWNEYITNNLLTENIEYGDDFMDSLVETMGAFETILREQGAIE